MQKIIYHLKIRSDVRLDGLALVYLYIRIDGVPKLIPTNISVPTAYWDKKKRMIFNHRGYNTAQYLVDAELLHEELEKAKNIILDAMRMGEILSVETFKRKFELNTHSFDLISFARNFIKDNPRAWSKTTLVSWNGLILLLEGLGDSISFADISEIREKLERHMRKNGYMENSIKKRNTQLKSLLKEVRKKYPIADPYTDPIGTIRGNRSFLTFTQLEAMIQAHVSNSLPDHLQSSLRAFLFMCFTGCRVSDFLKLTHRNIQDNMLVYIPQKTERYNKEVIAPLNDVARTLIENQSGLLFNTRSEGTYNKNIKKIAQILRIRKHITIHSARHTFGTMYIYLGGDITNLKEILAHSKLETTQIYVHLAKRLEAGEEKLFDKHFAKQMKVITKTEHRNIGEAI